jgi:hypothetical protein
LCEKRLSAVELGKSGKNYAGSLDHPLLIIGTEDFHDIEKQFNVKET